MSPSENFDPSSPLHLIGRELELQRIIKALAEDEDLLVCGVPGSGRRTLVRRAAKEVGAWVIEIDCIRAVDGKSFVKLLCESFSQILRYSDVQEATQQCLAESSDKFLTLDRGWEERLCLKPTQSLNEPGIAWQIFQDWLSLPKVLSEKLDQQVVLLLQGLPHIRCWDRKHEWEMTLRNQIREDKKVSYVIVATISESINVSRSRGISKADSAPIDASQELKLVELSPLSDDVIAAWIREVLRTREMAFNPLEQGLEIFLKTVQGHFGDARALTRRLLALSEASQRIGEKQVRQATRELLQDLAAMFEALLTILPDNQAQLLECLALYPTNQPQSGQYIDEHSLSRGGALQNALVGLQQKGLIYGPDRDYRLALPLLSEWIRQQLG